MGRDLLKLLTFRVDKSAAEGAFEVKMLMAAAMAVVDLIAGG